MHEKWKLRHEIREKGEPKENPDYLHQDIYPAISGWEHAIQCSNQLNHRNANFHSVEENEFLSIFINFFKNFILNLKNLRVRNSCENSG